jgi:hypothetical protein
MFEAMVDEFMTGLFEKFRASDKILVVFIRKIPLIFNLNIELKTNFELELNFFFKLIVF